MRESEHAALRFTIRASDGLASFGYENAKVKCPECDGWNGTVCPHGCGVRLISTQAEDDARFRERLRAARDERKARHAEIRARRSSP